MQTIRRTRTVRSIALKVLVRQYRRANDRLERALRSAAQYPTTAATCAQSAAQDAMGTR